MLRDVYNNWQSRAFPEIERIGHKFFPPILVAQPTDWSKAKRRVAYIGQETRGWGWTKEQSTTYGYTWEHEEVHSLGDFLGSPASIAALIEGYKQFDSGAHQPSVFNSPFWRYFRHVLARLQSNSTPTSVISTNLIRCAADYDGKYTLSSIPESDRNAYLQWQKGLLQAELAELDPTLIVFVTGPNYDTYLAAEFENLTFKPFCALDTRVAAKLESTTLTAPAYRTYHPAYLNRTIGFASLEAIVVDAGYA